MTVSPFATLLTVSPLISYLNPSSPQGMPMIVALYSLRMPYCPFANQPCIHKQIKLIMVVIILVSGLTGLTGLHAVLHTLPGYIIIDHRLMLTLYPSPLSFLDCNRDLHLPVLY